MAWREMSGNTRKNQVTRLVTLRYQLTMSGALILVAEKPSRWSHDRGRRQPSPSAIHRGSGQPACSSTGHRPRFHCSFSAKIGTGVRRACRPRELKFLACDGGEPAHWHPRRQSAPRSAAHRPGGRIRPLPCATTPNGADTSVPLRHGESTSSALAQSRRSETR
jgi:hypothetical protein